jgi:hypothetical protein
VGKIKLMKNKTNNIKSLQRNNNFLEENVEKKKIKTSKTKKIKN